MTLSQSTRSFVVWVLIYLLVGKADAPRFPTNPRSSRGSMPPLGTLEAGPTTFGSCSSLFRTRPSAQSKQRPRRFASFHVSCRPGGQARYILRSVGWFREELRMLIELGLAALLITDKISYSCTSLTPHYTPHATAEPFGAIRFLVKQKIL